MQIKYSHLLFSKDSLNSTYFYQIVLTSFPILTSQKF